MNASAFAQTNLPETDPTRVMTAVVLLAGALLLYILGRRVIRAIARPKYALPESVAKRAEGARKTLLRFWRAVAAMAAVVAVLAAFPGGFAHALAFSGLVGIVVAFVAQPLLRDVVAGFSVLLEGQYASGDRVRLFGPDVEGTVEAVGLRITVLREEGGTRLFVPNGSVTAVRVLTPVEGEAGRRSPAAASRPTTPKPPSGPERTEERGKDRGAPRRRRSRGGRRSGGGQASGSGRGDAKPEQKDRKGSEGGGRNQRQNANKAEQGGAREKPDKPEVREEAEKPEKPEKARAREKAEKAEQGGAREKPEKSEEAEEAEPKSGEVISESPWSIE